mmetsp:Transcript_28955/g.48864  ORF Transcript_28955/g.48864 Transcript_28955/m.48864 type:complete len:203 (+) Transcript_28955:257-865(+)
MSESWVLPPAIILESIHLAARRAESLSAYLPSSPKLEADAPRAPLRPCTPPASSVQSPSHLVTALTTLIFAFLCLLRLFRLFLRLPLRILILQIVEHLYLLEIFRVQLVADAALRHDLAAELSLGLRGTEQVLEAVQGGCHHDIPDDLQVPQLGLTLEHCEADAHVGQNKQKSTSYEAERYPEQEPKPLLRPRLIHAQLFNV